MFNLNEIDKHHFIISSDEPFRVEVVKTEEGQLVAYGYKGIKIDKNQEPDIVFDSIN